MSERVELPEEFVGELFKDPGLIAKLQRQSELDEFKEKYQVERSSSFRCPACNQYGQSGGSLWGPKKGTANEFVCRNRRCNLEWIIECKTKPNTEVMQEIKESRKG